MAIDKSVYQAPQGMEASQDSQEPDIEIEIEDPEAVKIGIGGVEIILEPGKDASEDFGANLAEEMDERDLLTLASELADDIKNDINSRRDWEADGIEVRTPYGALGWCLRRVSPHDY